MNKNILSISIVGILLIILVLFLNKDHSQNEIVVFLPSSDNPFWIEVRKGVEEKSRELGENYLVTIMASGNLDAASQVEQLKSVLARSTVDAIVIGVANNKAPAPIIANYNNADIPVVLIDTKLDPEASKESGASWDAFVGSDNRFGGEKAAEAMISALKNKGNRVLLIKGSYVHQSAIDRAEGFISANNGQLEIIEREGEWSRQRANEITTGVVTRQPIDGIFASNDDMALGAVAALKTMKLSSENYPVIIGFDATPAGVEAINNGEMYASIKQDAQGMGRVGVTLAQELIQGKTVPSETFIPVNVVAAQ